MYQPIVHSIFPVVKLHIHVFIYFHLFSAAHVGPSLNICMPNSSRDLEPYNLHAQAIWLKSDQERLQLAYSTEWQIARSGTRVLTLDQSFGQRGARYVVLRKQLGV